jgi:hypothetical protein
MLKHICGERLDDSLISGIVEHNLQHALPIYVFCEAS